ncbi:MAG: hypothetical protein QM778_25510 [Myxococcales bacterium]
MLAIAHVLDFLADELAGLRARSLARALLAQSTFFDVSFRHVLLYQEAR